MLRDRHLPYWSRFASPSPEDGWRGPENGRFPPRTQWNRISHQHRRPLHLDRQLHRPQSRPRRQEVSLRLREVTQGPLPLSHLHHSLRHLWS